VIKEISLSNCTEQVYLATCQNEALTVLTSCSHWYVVKAFMSLQILHYNDERVA